MQNLGARLLYAVATTNTATAVRCPYCVSGDQFEPMAPAGDGRFACGKCGHLAIPADKNFRCACRKCFELTLPRGRR